MIDFLANPSWLNPQIDFLLFLQNIRNGYTDILNNFLMSFTIAGEILVPTLIASIFYWCVDSKKGIYLFTLIGFNYFVSVLMKMLACVYRPWVLSSEIHPVEKALPLAQGYSFPSGHSTMAACVYGGIAKIYSKNKILVAGLLLFICFIGFSRMWLGVHTPQDVVFGILTGLVLVLLLAYFINKAEENKNIYLISILIIDIAAVWALIYMCYLKSYPIDYVNGTLLVNPVSNMSITIISYAYALGFINGGFLCRRYFPFEAIEGSLQGRILRGIIGAVLLFFIIHYGLEYVITHDCDYKLKFATAFVIPFFITAIYPLAFRLKYFK